MVKHVIVATCTRGGDEAIYVGGQLKLKDSTVYACDIAEHTKDGPINFSHVLISLPDEEEFPELFDECLKWVDEGWS
jgi:hypothetical protein